MSNRIQDYSFSLGAGVEHPVRISGFSSFTVLSTSGGSPVKVILDNGSYKADMRAGDGVDEIDLSDMKLLSAAAQTVVIRCSRGYQRASQQVNVEATATVSVANSNKGIPDVVVGAGLTEAVVGANSDRKAVVIKSRSANTDNVRLGNAATVGATTGNELEPGESATYETEGAIYAHNPGATDVTLTITELERL